MSNDTLINALELLRSQHEEVDALIEDLEHSYDADDKQELFQQLADAIAAHAAIEEKIFYPAVMTADTRALLIEFTEEHLGIKRLLADMMALDVEDEHFDAKLVVLKENFRHHAHDEEEGEMFPLVESMFSEDELAGIGNELLAMYDTLIERAPRMQVPAETSEAAELAMW